MKKWALRCGALLVFAGHASAQDHPWGEVFGGYSYVRVNPGNGFPGESFNGGSGSFSFNPTPWLGIVSDFGGYHWSGEGSDFTVFSYLFGPKIAFRQAPFTPFVQALFGGVRLSGTECDSGCGSGSNTGFATALGGGVDWNVSNHFGLRLVQAEYVLTKLSFFNATHQNNFRLSAGLVVRF